MIFPSQILICSWVLAWNDTTQVRRGENVFTDSCDGKYARIESAFQIPLCVAGCTSASWVVEGGLTAVSTLI
ncbi:hypothetical protein C8Q75DRAFT_218357 [Abortiporus biennis]|nr:hypothetical protein C8Q75DRAFT_218357 [Abortiporus biennis]